MTVLSHSLSVPIKSSRFGATRRISLDRDMHIDLLGHRLDDVLLPSEHEARAAAIKLRDLAMRVQLNDLEDGPTSPVSMRELVDIAVGLERQL